MRQWLKVDGRGCSESTVICPCAMIGGESRSRPGRPAWACGRPRIRCRPGTGVTHQSLRTRSGSSAPTSEAANFTAQLAPLSTASTARSSSILANRRSTRALSLAAPAIHDQTKATSRRSASAGPGRRHWTKYVILSNVHEARPPQPRQIRHSFCSPRRKHWTKCYRRAST